jgi:hypothetical protein
MVSVLRRFLVLALWASAPLCAGCNPDVTIGTQWGEWCADAPWENEPVEFQNERGGVVIPPGDYQLVYVSGAQIHDPSVGYEVTDNYYGKQGLEAGHHVFSGATPKTSATSVWLADSGLVFGGTIRDVEEENAGHTWPLSHEGGELYVTLFDDYYDDNSGPGVRLCLRRE